MALSSLPIWRDERLLSLKERAAGLYGSGPYFAAVVLFDLLPMRVRWDCPRLFDTRCPCGRVHVRSTTGGIMHASAGGMKDACMQGDATHDTSRMDEAGM
eukprot:357522-Chlamydomonas_euryale.AAC.1